MRLKSLSSRLFLVTAVALVPAVAIAISSIWTVRSDQTADLHADALRTAELVSREVEQTIFSVESVLRTLAAAPAVRQSDTTSCSNLLAEASGAVSYISAVFVVNDDGGVRCRSTPAEDEAFGTRPYFAAALQSEDLVTATLAEAGPGRPRLPIALRVGGTNGSPSPVMIAYLDLAWLEQRLQKLSLPQGGSLTIVDRSGTILARVPEPERFVGTKVREELLYLLEETVPGTLEVVSQDGTNRILGYMPPAVTSSGLYVSAGYSTEEGYATLRTVAATAGILALLGTALALILALYTARVFIARPVGVLIDTVTAWRNGNTAARTGMNPDRDEIGAAGAALDAFMVEVLANREARARADEARDLMRDELEHREKNLLATIQAIARQTFPAAGNEGAFRVFSDRMTAISEANRLLKQSGWKSMPLRNLILNGVSTFIGSDQDRVEAIGPDLVIKGNVAIAIGMSIHELCTNAVKYGALSNCAGKVRIEWKVEPSEKGRTFTLLWTERDGPPVKKPERTGFGSKVIRHALSAQTGGMVEIVHDPQGLVCLLKAPAEAVIAPAAA
ncbi:MAG TPA: sensor histidine kinase [Tabrizicola sp.]|nr:sensor histidine kinase [Tabrizicola sp.]